VETAPAAVSVSPASGSGLSQPFTCTVSSPSGYSNLSDVFALFNTTSQSTQNACYIHYNSTSNVLSLADNGGSNWLGGFVLGSLSASVGNSYCTIYSTGSFVSGSGTQLVLTVSVAFQTSFSGLKYEYLIGYDNEGLNTAWQPMGTWTVPAPQQYYLTTAVSPSGGGTISPGSGWYSSGSAVLVSASPNSGYTFSGFSGALSGKSTPQYVTMSGPSTVTANFIANQAAATTDPGCGPNTTGCTIGYTVITYVSPNGIYADAYTYTTTPDGSSRYTGQTHYASIGMAENSPNGQYFQLGNQCQAIYDGVFNIYQAFNYAPYAADAPIPCHPAGGQPPSYPVSLPWLYTATGVHQSYPNVVSGGAFNTYYYFGFVPAGSFWNFNMTESPVNGDFTTAGGPTLTEPAPVDGVTGSYNSRTQNTIGVHVDAPYSARKGEHILSFPTVVYGSVIRNDNLKFVVYDATPQIQSATPNPIPAGTPTTLTITGSSFGDHPTVYVNGTAYSVTSLARHSPGQDTVNVSVNVSTSQVSVPVYVVSNGAGGQAFFGTVLGSSQASNTVQVPVALLSISAIRDTRDPVPSGTFPTGLSGITFEIDGSNLGSGQPTLNFGACGITNVAITSTGNSVVTGTLDTTAAVGGSCTVTLTPYQSSQSATYTISVVAPPTISGSQGIWWLGFGYTINDNCVADSTDLSESCYYKATLLTLTPGSGATAPTTGSPGYWAFTDPLTGQDPTFVSHICADPACSQVTITAASPPPTCGTVNVTVTLGGVSSAVYPVYVDWPASASMVPNKWQDLGYVDTGGNCPTCTGYFSNITLLLQSACGSPMYGIDVHEEFPAGFSACGGSTGWTGPVDELGGWRTLATPGNLGIFGGDQVGFISSPAPGLAPQPQCPGEPVTGQCVDNATPCQRRLKIPHFAG
jgi:hypothetical protein